MRLPAIVIVTLSIPLAACAANGNSSDEGTQSASKAMPFETEVVADFDEPWAMTFMPDGGYLVTEKQGKLIYTSPAGERMEVAGVPHVDYGGQGGLGDIVLSPDFARDKMVFLSWVESGPADTRGAVVGRSILDPAKNGAPPKLYYVETIWKQSPKVEGRGHYSHRLAFSPDGKFLFIGSGERQKFDPAQDMDMNLGKIVRVYPSGKIPETNPFYTEGNPVRSQIWSLGHRNILGLAFDDRGRLWNQEMGPKGGDELNLVIAKANYGYPKVSNGDHYDGTDIPDHSAGDGFEAPKAWWNPAISPGGLAFYNADLFPEWKGSMFIGALGGKALVRVKIDGETATKVDQWDMGARIREVEVGPDGALWVLEDGARGSEGRLLKLTPKK